jgi:hypothetical protein
MRRTVACPVGNEKIDATAARINGGLVASIIVVAMVTDAPWLLGLLAVDLAVRVFVGFTCSPTCAMARWVARRLGLLPRLLDSAAKRFASLVALVLCVTAVVLAYAPVADVWFYVVAGVWAVCAVLESAFDFCLGCFIYGLLPESVASRFVRGVRAAA